MPMDRYIALFSKLFSAHRSPSPSPSPSSLSSFSPVLTSPFKHLLSPTHATSSSHDDGIVPIFGSECDNVGRGGNAFVTFATIRHRLYPGVRR